VAVRQVSVWTVDSTDGWFIERGDPKAAMTISVLAYKNLQRQLARISATEAKAFLLAYARHQRGA